MEFVNKTDSDGISVFLRCNIYTLPLSLETSAVIQICKPLRLQIKMNTERQSEVTLELIQIVNATLWRSCFRSVVFG